MAGIANFRIVLVSGALVAGEVDSTVLLSGRVSLKLKAPRSSAGIDCKAVRQDLWE